MEKLVQQTPLKRLVETGGCTQRVRTPIIVDPLVPSRRSGNHSEHRRSVSVSSKYEGGRTDLREDDRSRMTDGAAASSATSKLVTQRTPV